MLKAILHGKSGRIESQNDSRVSWRELYKAREDLLTAAVFCRFGYISQQLQAELLRSWLTSASSPFDDFEDVEFWPSFTFEHDDGTNRVEPDLVLRFASSNVIVEVKPPAGGNQHYTQWHKEIASFLNDDQSTNKPLYFLAIGRIEYVNIPCCREQLMQEFTELKDLVALPWQQVTNQLIEIEKRDCNHVCPRDRRVIHDMLQALSLYGLNVSPFKWEDLAKHSLPRIELETAKSLISSKSLFDTPSPQMASLLQTRQPSFDLSFFKNWN
ncbi:hypothetical protein MACH09_38030 [Vibrio sp. MACH09]|uniref:hypothetical protein n=1 Tax=Vibrio sp. MACH09 TaxID=3025122 RepID=UPI00278EBBF4|nr:hypothetical protein [Vibrio sp. MACH09]GLO63295.1 hypothetical protein MACH09_38030 [Vibrio sp. MACH09]